MRKPEPTIDQSQKALKLLAITMLVGLIAVFIYAVESKNWTRFFTSFGTGVVVAAASVLVGGLFGFLFGIPRTSEQPPLRPVLPPAGPDSDNAEDSRSARETFRQRDYQPNTNLEQISDWLTKILVGVGLIQIKQIGDKLYALSGGVAWALSDTRGNHTFALSLILFYLVIGFLFSYLWTRLYLPGALHQADLQIQDQLDSLATRVQEVDQKARDTQAASLGVGKESDEVRKMLLAVADDITPGDPDDPWRGRFGGKSINNARQLEAEVKAIEGRSGIFSIRLTVRSFHPETNPLKGAVQFFLHPTFNNPKPVVTVGPNGVAELNIQAWGAFTLGAVADDGQTKLELDLSKLETAPLEFRSR